MQDPTRAFENVDEHSLGGVLLARPDGTILSADPAACRAIGRSEEDICRGGRKGLVVEDDQLRDVLARDATSGSVSGELTFRRFDGSTFPAEFSSGFLPSAEGVPLSYVIFRDSTGRRRSAEARRDHDYLFASAQRVAHVATWSWTVGSTTVECSPETYDIYGLNPEMGPPGYEFFFTLIHPDDRHTMRQWVDAATADLRPPPVECRILRPDGRTIVIRAEGEVIETAEGVPSRIASTTYDVTDLQRADQALRDSEQRYRELFEASPVAVFLSEVLYDSEGQPCDCRFLAVNPAFERFAHTPAADLVGRTLFDFNPQTSRVMMERQGRVALTAAHAIGDDTLGYADESQFTHGSSEQRKRWFRRGFDSGDARQCDTFAVQNSREL